MKCSDAISDQRAVVARKALAVVALAGLTTLSAKIAIPLPYTPVPATLQVAAVGFVGSIAGRTWLGAVSMLLYLLLGLAGVPVFASWHTAGTKIIGVPTFGYLLGFPIAAWLSGRYSDKSLALATTLSLLAIYLPGLAWLGFWKAVNGGTDIYWLIAAGLGPFVVFDVLKLALATWTGRKLSGSFAGWIGRT